MRIWMVLGAAALCIGLGGCGDSKDIAESDVEALADIAPAAAPPAAPIVMVDTHVICIIRDSSDEIYYVSDGAVLTSQEGMAPATADISADYESFIKGRYNVGDTPSQAECELAQSNESAESLLERVSQAVYGAGGFITSVEYSFEPDMDIDSALLTEPDMAG